MALRIALFGQADFGRNTLDLLLEKSHRVVGVFAPPEGPRPDALAERAGELGIPLVRRRYYRKKTGEAIPAALEAYRALTAELNVLASVQVFLPGEIVDAPRHQSICFHPSLLPKYRGGAAMQWQIIDGVEETGVSIFVPHQGADTGPIVLQRGGVKLGPAETTASLFFDKLQPLGVSAIVEAVQKVDAGEARPEPQDESKATHQGLVDDSVAAVDLGRSAGEIDRLVRGCDPQPGAHVRVAGKTVRLYDVRLEAEEAGTPGQILGIDSSGLRLALRGGVLRIGRVRADMGKEAASAFAERAGLASGDRVESGGQVGIGA
ncbi:MAG: methionyl-tRNA formyltransferase [Myxococcota bacterium]